MRDRRSRRHLRMILKLSAGTTMVNIVEGGLRRSIPVGPS